MKVIRDTIFYKDYLFLTDGIASDLDLQLSISTRFNKPVLSFQAAKQAHQLSNVFPLGRDVASIYRRKRLVH